MGFDIVYFNPLFLFNSILVVCLSTNGERACLDRLHKTTIVLYDVFYLKKLLIHGDKDGFYIIIYIYKTRG